MSNINTIGQVHAPEMMDIVMNLRADATSITLYTDYDSTVTADKTGDGWELTRIVGDIASPLDYVVHESLDNLLACWQNQKSAYTLE